MAIEEYWNKFKDKKDIKTNKYDSFSFYCDDDSLLNLVLEGKKTATTSLYILYTYERQELPKVNEYSIVCDMNNNPRAIIKDVSVDIKPFKDVTEEFAKKEGEGDFSLEYWRSVHKKAFLEQLSDTPFIFSEDILVVLEEFEVCDKNGE